MTVHALTGCDTAPRMFGTGQGRAVNIMKKILYNILERMPVMLISCFMEGSQVFVAHCYGMNKVNIIKQQL